MKLKTRAKIQLHTRYSFYKVYMNYYNVLLIIGGFAFYDFQTPIQCLILRCKVFKYVATKVSNIITFPIQSNIPQQR